MIGSSLYEGIVGENFCLDSESGSCRIRYVKLTTLWRRIVTEQ